MRIFQYFKESLRSAYMRVSLPETNIHRVFAMQKMEEGPSGNTMNSSFSVPQQGNSSDVVVKRPEPPTEHLHNVSEINLAFIAMNEMGRVAFVIQHDY